MGAYTEGYFQATDKRGAEARQAHHRERHFLPEQGGLPLAAVAQGLPALANRVRPLAALGPTGRLGESAGRPERARRTEKKRRAGHAGLWPCRSAKRQDGLWQRRPGLRRQQEDERPQAPHRSTHGA